MRINGWLKWSLLVAMFGVAFTAGFMQSSLHQKPSSQAGDSASHPPEVTMIGCLVRIDTSARRPGTSDTIPAGPGRSNESSGFALKDAAIASLAPDARGPIDTRSTREFALLKGDVGFDRFAGQQVEVKGRLMGSIESPNRTDNARPVGSAGGDHAAGAERTTGRMIAVTTLRSIADTCPPPR